jgi:hypothetical protein
MLIERTFWGENADFETSIGFTGTTEDGICPTGTDRHILFYGTRPPNFNDTILLQYHVVT